MNDTQVMNRWVEALGSTSAAWELEELYDGDAMLDAFDSPLTFGTGGIRARMGIGPSRMNIITVRAMATALANNLIRNGGLSSGPVAIAYDTRAHSREFAEVTSRALACSGLHALLFPTPQPTPVLSFAVRELACAAGVVITASHNPREYNGFKVYGPTGCQATEALCRGVAREMEGIDPLLLADEPLCELEELISSGMLSWVDNSVLNAYEEAVLAQSLGVDCEDMRVAYTPLNGTGISHVPAVLEARKVHCSVVCAQSEPDGAFPTCPKPNPELSEAMELVISQALAEGADLALANDRDAGRVGVACRHENEMRLLSGDELGLLLFDFVCRAGRLPADPVAISTIASSPLLDSIASAYGVELRRTLSGFKYIGEQIDLLDQRGESRRFVLGMEESCGYLRGTHVRDKDGVVALMLACEMAACTRSTIETSWTPCSSSGCAMGMWRANRS